MADDSPREAELMTVKEVATYLRVHYKFAHKLVTTGVIPAKRVGAFWRIPRENVHAYISSDTTEQAS